MSAVLLSIRVDLGSAHDQIRSLSLDAISDRGGLGAAVEPAVDAADRAERRADSPLLGVLRPLPVVGDQVDAIRDITDRVRVVTDAAGDAVDRVSGRLRDADRSTDRVGVVDAMLDELDRVDTRLLGLAPPGPRPKGPVGAAGRDLDRALAEAPDRIDDLRHRLRTVRAVLEGPTRVLVLASNNAEMRAGMGMHLSAGVVTIEHGRFRTSEFVATVDLDTVTAGRAAVPSDLRALFGDIWDFGHEWRTVSTTPDFRTAGRILADLAARSPAGPVDMVVSVDAPALADLLAVTGPVTVDGRSIGSDDAVDVLLRDNYLRLGDVADAGRRRQLQSRIARGVFDALTDGQVDVLDLGARLHAAATGRHLLGWSADPAVEDLWAAIGADGALSPTSFMVAAQNASASKRDYYLDPTVSVDPVAGGAPGTRRYEATLQLENPVVSPTSDYVETANRLVPRDQHRAYVTFELPGAATDLEVVDGSLSRTGTDGQTVVAAVWLRVPVGHTGQATIRFSLPTGLDHVDAGARGPDPTDGVSVRPAPRHRRRPPIGAAAGGAGAARAHTPATSLSSSRASGSRWHRSHRSGTASRQATRPKSHRPL